MLPLGPSLKLHDLEEDTFGPLYAIDNESLFAPADVGEKVAVTVQVPATAIALFTAQVPPVTLNWFVPNARAVIVAGPSGVRHIECCRTRRCTDCRVRKRGSSNIQYSRSHPVPETARAVL